MIRIAIVDDEKQYADELAEFISRFSKETGVAVEIGRASCRERV